MKMKFCGKCDTVMPMNHKCKSGSKAPKTPSVNSHRRFRKLRMDIIVRDNGECVRCRVLYNKWTPNTLDKPLHAHHIKGQTEYPELAWEPNNIVTLCQDCHDVYEKGKVHELDFYYNIPPLYSF